MTAYQPDVQAEIAALRSKLSATIRLTEKIASELPASQEDLGRFRDLLVKQEVLATRLNRYAMKMMSGYSEKAGVIHSFNRS